MATDRNRDKRRKKRLNRLYASLDYGPSSIKLSPADVALTIEAEGTDGNRIPTFESVAYSGGKLFVAGFKDPVVVDLEGLEVNDNTTILLDHKPSQRVGHPTKIDVSRERITANGQISSSSSYAAEVVKSAKNGFRWQFSIGARIIAAVQLPAGKQTMVNGRTVAGPVIIATKSKLNEISFVGAGGDEGNQVRIAASQGAFAMTFAEWLKQNGYADESSLTPEQLKPLQAAYSLEYDSNGRAVEQEEETGDQSSTQQTVTASTTTSSDDDDELDPMQQQRINAAAECRRINEVARILTDHPGLQAQAIEEGWDEVRAELAQMRADRDDQQSQDGNGGGTAGHVRNGRMNSDQAIEASLCMQFGIPEDRVGEWYNDQTMEAALSTEYRGIGLHQLMYRTLHAAGRHFVPGRMDDETLRSFLQADQQLLQASAPGSLSHLATSGILSNTANKRLLDAFNMVAGIVPTIFGAVSVSDFKVNTGYRLAANGELEEVTAGGEIRHADLSEESFTNQAKTWGKMLTLSRKDMINDDLSAFDRIPRLLGRKARLKLEKEGIKLLLNPAAGYFTATNSFTGAGTALSITALTQAEQAFSDQVDSSNDPVLLTPRYLVSGTANKVTAQNLMTETRIISTDQAGSATTQGTANNPHAGKWDPQISPYVNNSVHALTNATDVLWYLIGDPADEPAFVISYLNGRRQPMIDSSDVDFNRLGMAFRVVWDFGVDEQESRACVRMVGS